jgi:hypothetical protein
MKKRSIPLGEILTDLGRITPEDIERALAFQREHGGFFGDALVALGIVSEEEIRFALADQYDLPVVHLLPANIDRGVARTVPAEWARERRVLPVLRDGDTVTVIAAAPPSETEFGEIRAMTLAERVEVAVSAPDTIAVLIDAVHQLASHHIEAATVAEWVAGAVDAGAALLGVSARGDETFAWFREGGRTVRTPVGAAWRDDIAALVAGGAGVRDAALRSFPAVLSLGDRSWRVVCSTLESRDALEFVVRIDAELPRAPAEVSRELRAALLPGAARARTLRVRSPLEPAMAGIVEALVPTLPGALLETGARSAHLSDRPVAVPPGVLALRSGPNLADTLAALEPLGLDALTLDVDRLGPDDLELACRVAPLVAFLDLPGLSKRIHPDHDIRLDDGHPPLWDLIT